MTNDLQIRKFIINWINLSNYCSSLLPEDAECSLIQDGYIDSLGFLNLIAAIEEKFSIEVDFEDISPEEFTTISGLTRSVAMLFKNDS